MRQIKAATEICGVNGMKDWGRDVLAIAEEWNCT